MTKQASSACVVWVMLLTAAVSAQPDLDLSSATILPAAEGAVIFNCLAGIHGDPFTAARMANSAGTVDATITLTLVDYIGNPIVNYPRENMWLATSGGGLVFCENGTIADTATNYAGQTVWQLPLRAGGCTLGETVIVMIDGQPLNQMGLPLAFVSAENDGNLAVDSLDQSIFAGWYVVPPQDPRADLSVGFPPFPPVPRWNLADVTYFTRCAGESCQP